MIWPPSGKLCVSLNRQSTSCSLASIIGGPLIVGMVVRRSGRYSHCAGRVYSFVMVNSLYKRGLLDANFSDPHILFRGEFVGVQI